MKITTIYSDGNEKSVLTESWDGSDWINSSLISTNYDSNNLKSGEFAEEWNGISWDTTNKWTYEYDKNMRLISILMEQWDGSVWNNYARTTFTYSNNGFQIDGLVESWDGSQWGNYDRYTYTYNNDNYFTYGKNFIYYGGSWISGNSIINVSNPDGFNEHYLSTEVSVYYKIINSIKNESNTSLLSFTLYQNYPNPFNPTTTINYSLAKTGNVKLTIYNTIGSKVATIVDEYKTAGNYSVQFNGSNLASGIYLYRLVSGNVAAVKKLILIK